MASREEAIKELARRELERRRSAPINPRERAEQIRAMPADQREQPSDAALRSPIANRVQSMSQTAGQGFADTGGMGFADEASAGIGSMISGDPYSDVLNEVRGMRDSAKEQHPGAYIGGQIGGAIAPFVLTKGRGAPSFLTGVAERGANLLARIKAGSQAGALGGGVYGFGSGEGVGDRLAGGAGGAAGGAIIGGAVPAVASGIKTAAKPLIDAVRARVNPSGFATQKVSERLAAGGVTPDVVATKMARNPGLSVADTAGKSARDLLRTAVNVPGPARDRVGTQLALRQMGQGDRLKEAVRTTLADPDGYLTVKDRIADTMKKVSKPLYDAFERSGVQITPKLVEIIKTPAGRAALKSAKELADNEGVAFTNNMSITARGWDYVKKALDDMVDAQTDSITKKMTNSGRILVGIKNDLLAEIDRVNPHYKPAREAWGGMKQLDDALEFGKKALTMTGEEIRRATAKFNPGQKLSMRVGVAEALRAKIDAAGWTNNAVLKLVNSRQSYGALKALFDNPKEFAEFRKTLFNEAMKRKTYDAVRGNSTTASQLADMMEAGGTNELTTFGSQAATGGVVNATLNWVGGRLRKLGGLTPQVADQMARKLMSTSPAQTKALVSELQKIEASRLSGQQRANLVHSLLSRVGTSQTTSAQTAQ